MIAIEIADLFLNRYRDRNFHKDRDRDRDRDFGERERANALNTFAIATTNQLLGPLPHCMLAVKNMYNFDNIFEFLAKFKRI